MADTSRPTETHGPVLEATPARQGIRGTHLIWVLVASTLLAALGLLIAWIWKAPDLIAADTRNGPARSGQAFQAPPPATPAPSGQPRPQGARS